MATWNSSFHPTMLYQSANRRQETSEADVFPRIQGCRHRASTSVGDGVPADSVPADVLLQLLVGFDGTNHRSFMDAGQLSRAAACKCVLADAVPLHVDRCPRDAFFPAAWVSTGVLLILPRREEEGFAVRQWIPKQQGKKHHAGSD